MYINTLESKIFNIIVCASLWCVCHVAKTVHARKGTPL